MGESEELLGSDVIVTHRMMKNNVVKATGIKPYLLITAAAFEHLRIEAVRSNFVKHTESYENVGEVDLLVAPLGMH